MTSIEVMSSNNIENRQNKMSIRVLQNKLAFNCERTQILSGTVQSKTALIQFFRYAEDPVRYNDIYERIIVERS